MAKNENKQKAQSILYQALISQVGIVVSVSDFAIVRALFYSARRELQDPALDCLELRPVTDNPDELWIVKKGASFDGPAQDE